MSQRAVNPRELFQQRERGMTPSDSDVPPAAPTSPKPGSPSPCFHRSPSLTQPLLVGVCTNWWLSSPVRLSAALIIVFNVAFPSWRLPFFCSTICAVLPLWGCPVGSTRVVFQAAYRAPSCPNRRTKAGEPAHHSANPLLCQEPPPLPPRPQV